MSARDEDDDTSDSEDDDYVPSGEESDVSVEDELEDDTEDVKTTKKSKGKRKVKSRGINFSEDGEVDENAAGVEETDNTNRSEVKAETEEVDKERADSLWADFLKDVDPPPKKSVVAISGSKTSSPQSNSTPTQSTSEAMTPPKKVTITKVYDFAGESVLVTKEVDCDSKEAKEFLSQQNCSTATNSTETSDKDTPKADSSKSPQASAGQGVKRASGVGNLVGQILKKKQKLNTLEKSKLDWDMFKQREGIDEELQRHNKGKDGYLERQAFLERTDLRQFEVEKMLRMKNRSNR